MNKMRFSIILSIIAVALVCASTAQAKQKELFTPCQYKATYRYYMEKGEDYLKDNQLESALLSYQRALMVQPNSEEACIKIATIKEMMRGKKKPRQIFRPSIAYADVVPEEPKPEYKPKPVYKKKPSRRVVASYSEPEPIPKPAYKPRPKPSYKEKPIEKRPIVEVEKKPSPKKPDVDYPSPKSIEKKPDIDYPSPKTIAKKPDIDYPSPKSIEKRPDGKKYPSGGPAPRPEPVELALKYPSAGPSPRIEPEFRPCRLPFYFNDFTDGFNDKIQQFGDSTNEALAPTRIRGRYRIGFGITEDDILWKYANADYHSFADDVSWRYLFGENRHNSYDPEVYSSVRIEIDNPITDTLSSYHEIVIDPWTFAGRKRMFITGSGGDSVEMDLKYWSNVSRTINESYRTNSGDIIRVHENKVHDGRLSPQSYSGLTDWGSNSFHVSDHEIDRMYMPIRKSWLQYNKDPYRVKLFIMSNQDEALTSDDPMRLSNNKVYWEESPWLDRYDHSKVFQRTGVSSLSGYNGTREPTKKGQWLSNLSFMARDSNGERLTFLRGASLEANFDNGGMIHMVGAAPRNLWDTYEQATSVPAAVRVKAPITKKLDMGGLYTMKLGFRHNSLEAINNLAAVDAAYHLFPNTQLLAEGAVSHMDVEEAIGYSNKYTGYGAMLGVKNYGPFRLIGPSGRYHILAKFTHMDDKFFPGLSNYRLTRKEFDSAKHIYFDQMNPEDEAFMVGDGVDTGRNVFGISLKAELPDSETNAKFDARTVHEDGGGFIENVFRAEASHQVNPKLVAKGLAYYQHIGKTHRHLDPHINAKNAYSAFSDNFSYEDVWLENTSVKAGEDPSIGSFSAGLEYTFTDYFKGMGIYEATNDPKDMPRGLLNDVYVSDYFENGVIWDQIVPFLYDQGSFGEAPYDYYDVFKTRFTYKPFDPITVTLKYVWNDNKYAMSIDDFATSNAVQVEYKPCNMVTLGLLYQYTRQRDLYKERFTPVAPGYAYDGHHNIFASMDYRLNANQQLRLMYGDYVGYGSPYSNEYDSIMALDTRHIFRIVYTGTWGGDPEIRKDTEFIPKKNELGPLRPGIPGAKFVTNLYAGKVKYEERAEIADAESNWEDYIGKIEFGLDAYDKEYWEGSLRFGLFGTTRDTERWDLGGSGEYQTNHMDFRGADLNFDIGWAISTPSKYISFTPLAHAGYRRIEFDRWGFSTTGAPIPQLGEAGQHFNLSFLGIGGKLDLALADPLNLYGKGYWAPLVYAPANNNAVGRFTVNNGVIWHGEAGCDYNLSDKFDISLGGFYDLQHLDRSERIDSGVVSAELPDNKLKTYGVKLGGMYKF